MNSYQNQYTTDLHYYKRIHPLLPRQHTPPTTLSSHHIISATHQTIYVPSNDTPATVSCTASTIHQHLASCKCTASTTHQQPASAQHPRTSPVYSKSTPHYCSYTSQHVRTKQCTPPANAKCTASTHLSRVPKVHTIYNPSPFCRHVVAGHDAQGRLKVNLLACTLGVAADHGNGRALPKQCKCVLWLCVYVCVRYYV